MESVNTDLSQYCDKLLNCLYDERRSPLTLLSYNTVVTKTLQAISARQTTEADAQKETSIFCLVYSFLSNECHLPDFTLYRCWISPQRRLSGSGGGLIPILQSNWNSVVLVASPAAPPPCERRLGLCNAALQLRSVRLIVVVHLFRSCQTIR